MSRKRSGPDESQLSNFNYAGITQKVDAYYRALDSAYEAEMQKACWRPTEADALALSVLSQRARLEGHCALQPQLNRRRDLSD